MRKKIIPRGPQTPNERKTIKNERNVIGKGALIQAQTPKERKTIKNERNLIDKGGPTQAQTPNKRKTN